MTDHNPWRQLPHDIYEKHMGHENVRQLEMRTRKIASVATRKATATNSC